MVRATDFELGLGLGFRVKGRLRVRVPTMSQP